SRRGRTTLRRPRAASRTGCLRVSRAARSAATPPAPGASLPLPRPRRSMAGRRGLRRRGIRPRRSGQRQIAEGAPRYVRRAIITDLGPREAFIRRPPHGHLATRRPRGLQRDAEVLGTERDVDAETVTR